MSEINYHDGPSRAWRHELITTAASATAIVGGGHISLYAAPQQELPLNILTSAYIFTVRKAVLPVVYSIAVGGLPTGMSLNHTTGVISGTPTVAEVTTAVFEIIDELGRIAQSQPVTFTVSGAGVQSLWDSALWDNGVWS